MNNIRFNIKTFGCKVNQYESQVLRENLLAGGCCETSPAEADVIIVNSCTVTGTADSKTRRFVRKCNRENPSARILVAGCSVVFPEDVKVFKAMPGVAEVVPNEDKCKLLSVVFRMFGHKAPTGVIKERVSGFRSHTRAFLKVQDGCDQNCSYCKVSLVRGGSRSKDKTDVIDELMHLVKKGYKEIVLTGICLGSWQGGCRETLSELLKEIDKIDGDFRVRLSSLEPNHITDDIIRTIGLSRRICQHFHIPLQSGSDRILGLMKRRYNVQRFRGIMESIRSEMPFAGITMDIIAGFPGETDDDLQQTLALLQEIKPSRLHVFGYSGRYGTESFKMTPLSGDIVKKRVEILIEAGEVLKKDFSKRFIGREVEILVEDRSENRQFSGYTREYVPVKLKDISNMPGEIINIVPDAVDGISGCLVT